MSYALRSDMVRLYSEHVLALITDSTGSMVVDEAALSGAMVAADAEIDTYLIGRYALPLQSTCPVLVNKSCAIARYWLDGQNGNEIVRNAYRDVIAWLKDVSAGRASLGLDSNHAPEKVAGGANIQSVARVFDRAGRG